MLKPLTASILIHAIPISLVAMQLSDGIALQTIHTQETAQLEESDIQLIQQSSAKIVSITMIIDEPAKIVVPKKKVKKQQNKEVVKIEPVPEPIDQDNDNKTQDEPDVVADSQNVQPAIIDAVITEVPATQAKLSPTQDKNECSPNSDGITSLSSSSWSIDRSLVDYYATHIPKLMKIAWVGRHKNELGKPDGFRVLPSNCSILLNGGIRSNDIITDVEGVKVHSIFTAIGAYFKLRNQSLITLTVKRDNQIVYLTYELLK